MIWCRIVRHKAQTYRYELVLAMVYTLVSVLAAYVFWNAMTGSGANIPGWTLKDLVFFALLIDFAGYVDGLLYYFVPTSGMIRRGELATMLLKPVPIWKALFPYRVGAEDVYATALKGTLVICIGLAIGYALPNIIIGIALVLVGALIENLVYATLMYTNFFIGDARPLVRAYNEVWGAARSNPVDAYRKSMLYWVLIFVVPLYFLGTLPMHLIMGRWDPLIILLPVLMAVWFAAVKIIWSTGLRRWEAYGG